jgi:uncharacterized membrane protein YphA (DoxX/SURF4 family)
MKTTLAASALSLLCMTGAAFAHASSAQANQYFESNSVVSLIALVLAVGGVVSADLLARRRRAQPLPVKISASRIRVSH